MHEFARDKEQTQRIATHLRIVIYQTIKARTATEDDLLTLKQLDFHERRVDDAPFPPRNMFERFQLSWHARAIRVLNSRYCMRQLKFQRKKSRNAR